MTEPTFKEIVQHDIDFAKQKEIEYKKMASDWRKNWKKNERMLAKMTVLAFVSIMLVIAAQQAVEASFGVTMKVKDVNSDSPTVKATVKTETGLKISKTVDLGKKADKADWDVIKLDFFFKSDSKAKIGTDFKACLDSLCKTGTNGPEHKPEVVMFSAEGLN